MHPFPLVAPVVPTEYAADISITTAIEQLLATSRGVSSRLIAVHTEAGIVELTGFADNLLAQQRAEEIAWAVRGVVGLHSTLAVRPAQVPDAQLQQTVTRALAENHATEDYSVHCRAEKGMITLSGVLHSWTEKELVLRVVKGVRGVRALRVEDLLIKQRETGKSDEHITAQISELLEWDIRLNHVPVEVRTHEQVVHLAGTVGTHAEKERITALAYQAGATRVDVRDLFVAYWAQSPELQREQFTPRADAAIAAAVRASLLLNPRVRPTETLVQVLGGVVTLAGTVSNLRIKQDAEQTSRQVLGVANVHNLLKVRPARLAPDEDICQTIEAALARDPYVGHLPFGVEVYGGQVMLTGLVASSFEQEQAGDVAAGVSGVVNVNNRLQVAEPDPSAPPLLTAGNAAAEFTADHTLAEHIRARYAWSARLHDQTVEVEVHTGRATLTGTVNTWPDRHQAAQEAQEAGAQEVHNQLKVRVPLTTPSVSHELLALPKITD